jgi:hypothetical protein
LQIRANAIEGLATAVLAEHAPALVRTLRMLGYTKATSALTSTVHLAFSRGLCRLTIACLT